MAGEVPNNGVEGENEIQRQAYEFCEAIRHAVELKNISNQLDLKAQSATSSLIQRSMFASIPFKLGILIPPGVEAYTTEDDEVVDDNPNFFEATEIRSISQRGVEFFDSTTNRWLKIQGYDFEVSPIFPSDPGGEVQSYSDFSNDQEARSSVTEILSGSWTKEGLETWWQHPKREFEGKTPAQMWEENPQAVMDLAQAGRDQTGT